MAPFLSTSSITSSKPRALRRLTPFCILDSNVAPAELRPLARKRLNNENAFKSIRIGGRLQGAETGVCWLSNQHPLHRLIWVDQLMPWFAADVSSRRKATATVS